jgi:16S rRNA (adenine1518-N6/adenine1519-N6)-dimethyltransferase
MVQREVADRLASPPGSRDYGLLSVLVQRSFTSRVGRLVPPGAFLPPPKVHSAVVVLEAHGRRVADDRAFIAAARAAFHNRRKTIKNSLGAGLGQSGAALEDALREAGIDPGARAETLELAAFERLAQALVSRGLLDAKAAT